MSTGVLPLVCPAQNYAWGRPADRSSVRAAQPWQATLALMALGARIAQPCMPCALLLQVAKLAKANGVAVDDTKPYAELW